MLRLLAAPSEESTPQALCTEEYIRHSLCRKYSRTGLVVQAHNSIFNLLLGSMNDCASASVLEW